MRTHTILFSASGSLTAAYQRWAEPLLKAWPGDDPPRIEGTSLATLMRLLELGTVPILNENDSVSVRERRDRRIG